MQTKFLRILTLLFVIAALAVWSTPGIAQDQDEQDGRGNGQDGKDKQQTPPLVITSSA